MPSTFISTSDIATRVRSANRILATYTPPPDPTNPLTSAPSTPFLQWCFSEPGVWDHICPPLWFIAPEMDADGNPVYDYRCRCGVNVAVHSPDCQSLTIPITRMARTKTAPLIENSWVLCRWNPPPPLESWLEEYGTVSGYPHQGRYLPVSSNNKVISLPAETPPFPETSNLVIQMFKEHEAIAPKTLEEIASIQAQRDYVMPLRPDGGPDHGAGAPPGSRFSSLQQQFKDKMTFPGPKIYQPGVGENPATKPKPKPKPKPEEPLIKVVKD